VIGQPCVLRCVVQCSLLLQGSTVYYVVLCSVVVVIGQPCVLRCVLQCSLLLQGSTVYYVVLCSVVCSYRATLCIMLCCAV